MHRIESQFFQEEVREDYTVTEKMKKVWYIEISLLEELDRVCKKYHLQYFVAFGTLLGTIRHKGFIPWDDDLDVMMFRDDYEKLKLIAEEEFRTPYFFQNSYTDAIIWALAKLRDSRTTAIEFFDCDSSFNQGIFIDIFPLDDVPDESLQSKKIYLMKREMWMAVVNEEEIKAALENGQTFMISNDILWDLLKLPIRDRVKEFEAFCNANFGVSENINFITEEFLGKKSIKRSWCEEVIYMPFEYIQVPVPVGYEQMLDVWYGNWHEFVKTGVSYHEGIILEPDMPYKEYLGKWSNKI